MRELAPHRRHRPVRRHGAAVEQPVPGCSAVRPSERHTFILPERVYEELTVDNPDVEAPPIDAAIDEGWATVAAPIEFSEPVVSRVMDGVQRYIANADDWPTDEVERADAALAAVGAQHLSAGTATEVYTYTTEYDGHNGFESWWNPL